MSEPGITLLTLFAGRWVCLEAYLWALDELECDPKQLHLLWYVNSPDLDFQERLRKELKAREGRFASARLLIDNGRPVGPLAHREREGLYELHAQNINYLYNNAIRHVQTEMVFFLEDDVIVPSHALKRLLPLLQPEEVAYAMGAVFDRHHYGLVAWDLKLTSVFGPNDTSKEGIYEAIPASPCWGIRRVGLGGLACCLVKMAAIRAVGDPPFKYRVDQSGSFLGCDMVFCRELEALGLTKLIDYGVRALHMDSHGQVH